MENVFDRKHFRHKYFAQRLLQKDSGGDTGADTAYIKNITATALDGGQTATVQSETFSEDTQISVPEGAIQYAENIYYVYETEKR